MGPAPGRGHHPGTGVSWDPGLRPSGPGGHKGVLRQLFGQAYVPHHSGQARDEPGLFGPEDGLDRSMSFSRRHVSCLRDEQGARQVATDEASAAVRLFAGPVMQFGDLRRQGVAEVGSLEHRADLDLARAEHRIGAALHPLDRLGDVLDLP
jgi:hypothetical protein